jgi:hypothetical protein
VNTAVAAVCRVLAETDASNGTAWASHRTALRTIGPGRCPSSREQRPWPVAVATSASKMAIDGLISHRDVGLREKTFYPMLYERDRAR